MNSRIMRCRCRKYLVPQARSDKFAKRILPAPLPRTRRSAARKDRYQLDLWLSLFTGPKGQVLYESILVNDSDYPARMPGEQVRSALQNVFN